ncbi:hypothetical protein GMRT_11970 [Giardia muris]|uniref:Uncharacterized protein n=1 Tax=Giardia muris TaxID=5742 RepID=A0A4Z1T7U7_GIAMU|nr:hypothetical protein GMRT_11970 [Giardia muris]|eukprot:TNJ29227.1 hypothetical protein GMRT_11970 [Giardia muris]
MPHLPPRILGPGVSRSSGTTPGVLLPRMSNGRICNPSPLSEFVRPRAASLESGGHGGVSEGENVQIPVAPTRAYSSLSYGDLLPSRQLLSPSPSPTERIVMHATTIRDEVDPSRPILDHETQRTEALAYARTFQNRALNNIWLESAPIISALRELTSHGMLQKTIATGDENDPEARRERLNTLRATVEQLIMRTRSDPEMEFDPVFGYDGSDAPLVTCDMILDVDTIMNNRSPGSSIPSVRKASKSSPEALFSEASDLRGPLAAYSQKPADLNEFMLTNARHVEDFIVPETSDSSQPFITFKNGEGLSELEVYSLAFDTCIDRLRDAAVDNPTLTSIKNTLVRVKSYYLTRILTEPTTHIAYKEAANILDAKLFVTTRTLDDLQRTYQTLSMDHAQLKQAHNHTLTKLDKELENNDNLQKKTNDLTVGLHAAQDEVRGLLLVSNQTKALLDEERSKTKRLSLTAERLKFHYERIREQSIQGERKANILETQYLDAKKRLEELELEQKQWKVERTSLKLQYEKDRASLRAENERLVVENREFQETLVMGGALFAEGADESTDNTDLLVRITNKIHKRTDMSHFAKLAATTLLRLCAHDSRVACKRLGISNDGLASIVWILTSAREKNDVQSFLSTIRGSCTVNTLPKGRATQTTESYLQSIQDERINNKEMLALLQEHTALQHSFPFDASLRQRNATLQARDSEQRGKMKNVTTSGIPDKPEPTCPNTSATQLTGPNTPSPPGTRESGEREKALTSLRVTTSEATSRISQQLRQYQALYGHLPPNAAQIISERSASQDAVPVDSSQLDVILTNGMGEIPHSPCFTDGEDDRTDPGQLDKQLVENLANGMMEIISDATRKQSLEELISKTFTGNISGSKVAELLPEISDRLAKLLADPPSSEEVDVEVEGLITDIVGILSNSSQGRAHTCTNLQTDSADQVPMDITSDIGDEARMPLGSRPKLSAGVATVLGRPLENAPPGDGPSSLLSASTHEGQMIGDEAGGEAVHVSLSSDSADCLGRGTRTTPEDSYVEELELNHRPHPGIFSAGSKPSSIPLSRRSRSQTAGLRSTRGSRRRDSGCSESIQPFPSPSTRTRSRETVLRIPDVSDILTRSLSASMLNQNGLGGSRSRLQSASSPRSRDAPPISQVTMPLRPLDRGCSLNEILSRVKQGSLSARQSEDGVERCLVRYRDGTLRVVDTNHASVREKKALLDKDHPSFRYTSNGDKYTVFSFEGEEYKIHPVPDRRGQRVTSARATSILASVELPNVSYTYAMTPRGHRDRVHATLLDVRPGASNSEISDIFLLRPLSPSIARQIEAATRYTSAAIQTDQLVLDQLIGDPQLIIRDTFTIVNALFAAAGMAQSAKEELSELAPVGTHDLLRTPNMPLFADNIIAEQAIRGRVIHDEEINDTQTVSELTNLTQKIIRQVTEQSSLTVEGVPLGDITDEPLYSPNRSEQEISVEPTVPDGSLSRLESPMDKPLSISAAFSMPEENSSGQVEKGRPSVTESSDRRLFLSINTDSGRQLQSIRDSFGLTNSPNRTLRLPTHLRSSTTNGELSRLVILGNVFNRPAEHTPTAQVVKSTSVATPTCRLYPRLGLNPLSLMCDPLDVPQSDQLRLAMKPTESIMGRFRPAELELLLQGTPSVLYPCVLTQHVNMQTDFNLNSPLQKVTFSEVQQLQNLVQAGANRDGLHVSTVATKRGLLPRVGGICTHIRRSALNVKAPALSQPLPLIFQLVQDLSPRKCEFIVAAAHSPGAPESYISIPSNNACMKSLAWTLRLIRTILLARISMDEASLAVKSSAEGTVTYTNAGNGTTESRELTRAFEFEHLPGALMRLEAESLPYFIVHYAETKYGMRSIVATLLWSLIVSVVYYQYENQEVHLFARLLFGDLDYDYYLTYLDLLRMVRGEYASTLSTHLSECSVSLNVVPDLVAGALPNWDAKRQYSLLDTILTYATADNRGTKTIPFWALASLILSAYGNYRRLVFQNVTMIWSRYNAHDYLDEGGFRELCDLALGQFRFNTITSIFYAFTASTEAELASGLQELTNRRLSYPGFVDFYLSFCLGRYCLIPNVVLDDIMRGTVIKRNIQLVTSSYVRMTELVRDLLEVELHDESQDSRLQNIRYVLNQMNRVSCDLAAYDYVQSIANMRLALQCLVDRCIDSSGEAASMVIGGGVAALATYLYRGRK